jgi:hypothetical protein
MSTTHRSDTPFVPGFHHSGDRGLGVRGADIPSTGEHGPGFLYPGITLPAEANDEFRIVILTVPPGLESLFVNENSSATTAAGLTGTFVGTYEAFKNGVSYGTSTYTVSFGDGLTGTLVFDDILASGQIDGAPVTAPSLGRAVAPRVGLTADGKLIILF